MLKVTTIQKENSLQRLIHCLLKKRAIIHPRIPRGSQSGRVKRRDERFQALKTFVPPFLPTRLTAPGSPRMAIIQLSRVTKATVSWSLTEPLSIVVNHDFTKFDMERN